MITSLDFKPVRHMELLTLQVWSLNFAKRRPRQQNNEKPQLDEELCVQTKQAAFRTNLKPKQPFQSRNTAVKVLGIESKMLCVGNEIDR